MNEQQRLWWEQTKADHVVLQALRRNALAPSHQLHYLQMIAEKLSKAYFWRVGKPPATSHNGFVRFLQSLNHRKTADLNRIAASLGFRVPSQFKAWVPTIASLARDLERLAPALAGDGPNPEYPWPRSMPEHAPVSFSFPVWHNLTQTGRGKQFLRVVDAAVEKFPIYA